jgi:hypothetical protein
MGKIFQSESIWIGPKGFVCENNYLLGASLRVFRKSNRDFINALLDGIKFSLLKISTKSGADGHSLALNPLCTLKH